MQDESVFRNELRNLDGDLFLCHLFAPAERRLDLLTLYTIYADTARIPSMVSEPMLGAIRFQWWRDVIDGRHADTAPAGAFLQQTNLPRGLLHDIVNGREALFEIKNPTMADLEQAARNIGRPFVKASMAALGQGDLLERLPETFLSDAGGGFELLRLSAAFERGGQDGMIGRARSKLRDAAQFVNGLPRRERKSVFPACLIIGLAKKHAESFQRNRSLFYYQLVLLKMALTGRL